MSIFEEGNKRKVRFNIRGVQTMEDLYDLSMNRLAELARKCKNEIPTDSDDLDFLETNNKKGDGLAELKYEIVKAIYISRKEELQASANAKTIKDFNQNIDELIAEKQINSLKNMSIEELEAMRK